MSLSLVHRPALAGFAVDGRGRVVALGTPGIVAAATVRLDGERITIEVDTPSLSVPSMVVLRHWLLTLATEDKAFHIIEGPGSRAFHLESAVDALARLELLLLSRSISPSHLPATLPLVAGPRGVVPLDEEMKARLGMLRGSDREAAIRQVRSLDRIAFLPDSKGLIVLAPAGASPDTLRHARAWLSAQGGTSIRLRVWLGQGWVNEVAGSGPAAGGRLSDLTSLQRLGSPPSAYQGRRIRAEDMSADEIRFFSPLLALAGTTFSSESFAMLLRHGFGDRLFLTGVREGQGRYIVHGQGLDYVGSLWRHKAPGLRVLDQPDREYGRHVNDRMVATATDGVPHVEEVQACIRESGDDQQLSDVRLSKYLRVAVPCRAGGESLIASYSLQRRWDTSPTVTAS